ncbi:MAG: choline dehydrogenase-like flavoprotein/pimeloyl-ACP methyl ester carboxylesterase [Arenicella sp.]|jgi:choline dehydrogenase-like flavoprotein/pimeloyl-ACP methyl ester carboxylesterase
MGKKGFTQYSSHAAETQLPSKAWLANGIELLFQRHGLNRQGAPFDVVIVGSGYGGSIAALELSKAKGLGLSICLLERGREFLPGSFPSSMSEAPTEFRTSTGSKPKGNLEGLFDIRLNKDLNILQANGLGGGSLINAGVMARANSDVFEGSRWPTAITSTSLEKHYDQAELLLGSKNLNKHGELEDNTILLHPNFQGGDKGPAKYQSLKTLARGSTTDGKENSNSELASNGFKNANITVNMNQGQKTSAGLPLNACNLCGDCASGCNNNAKISLDKNLLFEAADNGVEIFTGVTVLALQQGDSESWLLDLVYTDAQLRTRQSQTSLTLETAHVILSAGALGSTEILKRSQSIKLPFSHKLGKQFSSNGDMLAVGFEQTQLAMAIADPTMAHSKRGIGPTITGMIDSRNHPDHKQRMVIQEMAVPAAAAHFFSELYATVNSVNRLSDSDKSAHQNGSDFSDPAALNTKALNHTSLYAVMGNDGADGALVLESSDYQEHEGTIEVKWPGLKEHSLFDQQIDRLKNLSSGNNKLSNNSALGGSILANPVWQLLKPEYMNMMSVNRGAPLTVHPLGGCPMGTSEIDGTTNHLGQVFKPNKSNDSTKVYKGLTVLDGAIIPEAVGINPALTISAITLRAVSEQIRLNFFIAAQSINNQELVQSRQKKELDVPIIRSLKQLEEHVTAQQKETEIQITERLVGFSKLESDAGIIQDVVIELTLWSKSVAIKSLYKHGIHGSKSQASIAIDCEKSDPVSKHTLSKIRIYQRRDWDHIRSGKTKVDRHEIELDRAAKFIGKIDGSLDIFERAESYPMSRIVESGWGWLLNRGLRDLYQVRRPVSWGKAADAGPKRAIEKPNVVARFINLARTLSRAGEIRTLNYNLTVIESLKTVDFSYFGPDEKGAAAESQKKIVAVKQLTYQRRANPWVQLAEASLQHIPTKAETRLVSSVTKKNKSLNSVIDSVLLEKQQRRLARNGNALALDMNYLSKAGIPLIRITQQQNQVTALMDLSSLGAYMTRLLLGVHFYSFRAPDAPRPRKPKRLAGKTRGLPMPSVQRIVVGHIPDDRISKLIKGQDVEIVITHFANHRASKPPVMMLHGYSGSSAFFAHASTPNNLAKFMYDDDRDVWLVDLRTSSALASARYPWSFETVSSIDIPRAVKHIYEHYHAQTKIDLVTHCMGSVMLGMSILRASDERNNYDEHFYKNRINRIVFSQATPTVVFSQDSNFRSFITNYSREMVPDDYQFQVKEDEKASQILDRVLYTLPYPQKEYDLVNAPMRPARRAEFARTRHRVDAFFSRTFELANLSTETLEHIDDFFGPIHVDTIIQASRFADHNVATNARGENSFVSRERLQKCWAGIPTMSFHSANNGLIDFSTGERTKQVFQAAGVDYQSIIINKKSYGHQDSIIGVRAHLDVFPHITEFLNRKQDKPQDSVSALPDEAVVSTYKWVVEAPAYGPIIIDQNSKKAADSESKIMLGSNAARASRPYCIFVPIVFDQDTLRIAGSGASQQAQILDRYIAQSLPLKNTSSEEQVSRWHVITLPNSMLSSPEHPVDQQHGSVKMDGLAALMIYDDLTELDSSIVVNAAEQHPSNSNSASVLVNRRDNETINRLELQSIIHRVVEDFINSNRNVRHEFAKSIIEYKGRLNKTKPSLSFAIGSCQYPAGMLDKEIAYRSYQQLNQLLESKQTNKPEFIALLGDQIYADATAGFLDPSSKFDQFVMPYYRLYENQHVRSVLRKLPLYAMLDDHELSDNWEPVTNNPRRQKVLAETLDIGVRSFLKFQRGQTNTQLHKHGSRPPLWYSFERNDHHFFMCDTRTERSARTATNILQESTTIMRAAQQSAIESWLQKIDKNQIKFILSSSIFLPRHRLNHASENSAASCIRSDGWDGYPVSLYKMLAMVVDQNINKLVFLSGDEHIGCYADINIYNLSSGKTAQATSVHCPGLYTPFPFANGRIDDFDGDLEPLQNRYISDFTFKHQEMSYRCTVSARFELTGSSATIGPVEVELCGGFLIIKAT